MACSCKNGSWTAIMDKMPAGRRLRVSGTAECSTMGYKNVRLVPTQLDGFNPRIRLLELRWDEPHNPVGDKISPHAVAYEESDCPEYDAVEITNCNQLIKVETVHA